MLSDQDLMQVQAVAAQLAVPVTIYINPTGTDSLFETNLSNIARQVSGVSMNQIHVEEGHESVFPGVPSLTLSDGSTPNIHYMTAPEGNELAPFLDAISWLGKGKALPSSRSAGAMDHLALPVNILLLVAHMCPHCPQVVQAALSLAVGRPTITVSIVDALEFTDLADRFKVKSTPTVVINGGMTTVGHIGADDLAQRMVLAVGPGSLTEVLDSMIKSGRAEDAGRLVCEQGKPEALLPIYLAKEFSLRMGALVAMEEALEKNPRIFDSILDRLAALLSDEEAGLRGDTAEFLGKIGNPAAAAVLRHVAENDSDPDVREAAEEALLSIEG